MSQEVHYSVGTFGLGSTPGNQLKKISWPEVPDRGSALILSSKSPAVVFVLGRVYDSCWRARLGIAIAIIAFIVVLALNS